LTDSQEPDATVQPVLTVDREDTGGVTHLGVSAKETAPAAGVELLNADQRRAYDVVLNHLEETLGGRRPGPLRLIVYGEGGTGKSKVIEFVTAAFAAKGVSHLLVKAAYTGVAASVIDGKTTHTIGQIGINRRKISEEGKRKLQAFWRNKQYLIIDEISMISKRFLAQLSRNISIGLEGACCHIPGSSFGGLNVIVCGDFHQFPPVATSPSEALYYPDKAEDNTDSHIGRAVYEEFDSVVILREQRRVTDVVWRDFLSHLRRGVVRPSDIKLLRSLILTTEGPTAIDPDDDEWNKAILITPRNAVKSQWNKAAVRKWCKHSGRQLFICPAEDTVNGRPPNLLEKQMLANHRRGRRNTDHQGQKDLPAYLELAIGARVILTENISTDLDLANGATGEVVGIALHPDEPAHGDQPEVNLLRLPKYILVKLEKTRAGKLSGLEEKIVPIECSTTTYQLKMEINGRVVIRTVTRHQFPMSLAYALTDYRAQGQTIPRVYVDIASPPTGGLSLFSLYVALSRSSGRGTIRLLRDFDENLFKKTHSPALVEEDDRLGRLSMETMKKMNERLV
jgi:hypothetical protein